MKKDYFWAASAPTYCILRPLVAVVGNRVVDADFVISAAGGATAASVEALRLGRFEVEIELRVAVWFTIEFDLHRINPGSPGTGEDHAEIDVGSGLADGQLELVEGPWRGTSCPAKALTGPGPRWPRKRCCPTNIFE
jgi:hypothetical protein